MKFKIDENLPVDCAELLQSAGHRADTVADEALGGEQDPRIAKVCAREQRILVTLDLDFADVRTYPPERYPGVIVLRVRRQDKRLILQLLRELLPLLEDEPLAGRLWIVEEERLRIRGES